MPCMAIFAAAVPIIAFVKPFNMQVKKSKQHDNT